MKGKTGVFLLLATASLWLIFGCGPKTGLYGKPLTETKVVSILDILKAPDNFAGKVLRVEGKIVQECPTGGWIMLKDDSAVIFVDFHPTQIAIPQATSHSAAVQGKVLKQGTQVSIIGEGIELK